MTRICVAGTTGKTSLIHRMLYNTFTLQRARTRFITKYKVNGWEIIEIPDSEHAKTMQCDILILACKTQLEVLNLAEQWFGYHKHLFVALVDAPEEQPILCPEPHIVHIDNMANEGIQQLLHLILTYK